MPVPAIAFFDVDHTLTHRSTGGYFAAALLRRRVISLGSLSAIPAVYLRYHFGPSASGGESLLPEYYPTLAGLPEAELRAVAARVVEKRILPSLYPAAIALVAGLRADGARVVLATSSFDMLIEPVARHLGVADVIASAVEFADGASTGRFIGGLNLGTRKLERCRQAAEAWGVSLGDCAFYSDSVHDLPLLREVGSPVAVNPDARLRLHARRHGWETISWRH